MTRLVFRHIIRFVFMILLQVLVVNRLDILDGLMLPFVYIYAILILPFETPSWLRLFLAFGVGLIVDGFMDTPGFHASACVWLVFIQIGVLKVLTPREGYDFGQEPTVQSRGLQWYLMYAGSCILLFHVWLFFVEILSFSHFIQTLLKIFVSSFAALAIMVIAQFITYSQRKKG